MQVDPRVLSQPGSAQKVPGLLLRRLAKTRYSNILINLTESSSPARST